MGWEREGEKLIRADEKLEDQITWRPGEFAKASKEICTFFYYKALAMNQYKSSCVALKNMFHSLMA